MIFSGIQKKTRALLILAVCACLFLSSVYGASVYLLRQKGDSVATLPASSTFLAQRVLEYQNAKRLLAETATARAYLSQFLFTKNDAARFFGDIESAARQVGADMTLVSADASDGQGLRVEADVAGTWQGVARLLALLETYPAPIVVTVFTARTEKLAGNAKGAENVWRGTIIFTLKSYIDS